MAKQIEMVFPYLFIFWKVTMQIYHLEIVGQCSTSTQSMGDNILHKGAKSLIMLANQHLQAVQLFLGRLEII